MASIKPRSDASGFSPISKTFVQLKDAQQWIRQTEIRLDRNELPPNRKLLNTITLRELVVRYREEVVPAKKRKEIETIILNAFLRHPICKKSIVTFLQVILPIQGSNGLEKSQSDSLEKTIGTSSEHV